tara:strand:- start:216 stop:959 length:744 start_codon:yes stop_codon:yes gene_type:complete
MFNIKEKRRALARKLIGNRFDLAYYYCQGFGIEIGAMSSPYSGFSSSTKVKYADIYTSSELRRIISSLNVDGMYEKKIVETDILLKAPTYSLCDAVKEEVNFVYSSNVFEHHPNPIYSLLDQLKCTTDVVYLVIPNKNYTYDKNRATTSIKTLTDKYENEIFSNSIEEAIDVIVGTYNHPVYDIYKNDIDKYSKEMIEKKEGIHHFYTYDLSNVLDILAYANKIINFTTLYISADNTSDMHVAIRKL